jgi:hypothetical protein
MDDQKIPPDNRLEMLKGKDNPAYGSMPSGEYVLLRDKAAVVMVR